MIALSGAIVVVDDQISKVNLLSAFVIFGGAPRQYVVANIEPDRVVGVGRVDVYLVGGVAEA